METEQAPSQFGKYQLLARLARGGMAETFRAQLTGAAGVTKQVVIKKVLPAFAEDEAFVEAFINEAKLSASLSHGNIAQVFDFGRLDGDYFIAMELVEGRSLAQMLKRAAEEGYARIPTAIACYLAIEVLKGLHYAHTRSGTDGAPLNIVHRDVTPENVLVSFEGETKVVDFGVAKAAMKGRAETEPGLVKGKFLYFSPEQAHADPLDGRSDVFAVGVMLYRMLCGELPFQGQMHVVMRSIITGQFKPALVVNPGLPPPLAVVLTRAMATRRDDRFATALEMQQALTGFLYRGDPDISSETIKDWMLWLFEAELKLSGRAVKVSSRLSSQLLAWSPARDTTPAAPQITREEKAFSEEAPLATTPIQRKGLNTLLLISGGALAALTLLLYLPSSDGPTPAEPVALHGLPVQPAPKPREADPPIPVRPPPPSPAEVAAPAPATAPAPVARPERNMPRSNEPFTTPGTVVPPAYLKEAVDLIEQSKDLMKEKQFPTARARLERCIRLEPKLAECHKLLGTVYAKTNESERGAKEYRLFMKYAPSNDPDREKVKSILEMFEHPSR
jgi:serine/threonine-protein kinase